MNEFCQTQRILVADDDPDDQLLVREAFQDAGLTNPIDFVMDGVQLLDYLRRENEFSHLSGVDLPSLILLDLNMPRMDGREALEIIKLDTDLRRIPVVILTTSNAEEDMVRTYDLGASSFITKPVSFSDLVVIAKALKSYWLETVELPPH